MSSSKKWLDAQTEPNTTLRALPSYLALADLKNDNYFKLIAVEVPADLNSDVKSKLRVYKGTTLISEQGLPGYPTAIQTLYVDDNAPRLPIIAVAIGPSVYFYKNMKPFYKYTFPSLPIDTLEKDLWIRLPIDKANNYEASIKKLKSISIKDLSIVSQKLLTLPVDERQDFITYHAEKELQRLPTIVAMATIRRSSSTSSVISSLVLASEYGDIIILDTQAFTILHQARSSPCNTPPSHLSVSGQVDVDFRIVIATRDGSICMLRKGWLEGKPIFKLDHPAIGISLLPIEQTIIVVCMNNSLDCFTKKGKKLWSVELCAPAVCMVPVNLQHIGETLVCVALRGGLVQLYMNKVVVDQFNVSETVSAMTFGRLGQEDHVLVLITIQGSLIVKILKRTAEFKIEAVDYHARNHENTSGSLQIPKKTKVFVEQTIRERENASAIYNSFQSELWRLRLMAARATVDAINSAESTISGDIGQAPIKLSAEVCGLGPIFQLFLVLENMAARKMAFNLNVLIHFNHRHFHVENPYITLPPIVPGAPIKLNVKISAIIDKYDKLPPADLTTENSFVKVMVVKSEQAKPLLVATVTMPPLENIDIDIY